MTESDSTGIAKSQLRDPVADFQPQPCNPLPISPWVAMSLLKKAIRRGRRILALMFFFVVIKDTSAAITSRPRLLFGVQIDSRLNCYVSQFIAYAAFKYDTLKFRCNADSS
jgi:hypothetical protein